MKITVNLLSLDFTDNENISHTNKGSVILDAQSLMLICTETLELADIR